MTGIIHHPSTMPTMKARKGDSPAISKVFRLFEKDWEVDEGQCKGKRTREISNPYSAYFKGIEHYNDIPNEVENVIHGIAFLDHYNKGMKQDKSMSKVTLSHLLSFDTLSTPIIMQAVGVGERQAQRYLKAVKLAIQHLDTHQHTLQKDYYPLIKKWCKSVLADVEEMLDDIEEWEEESGEVFNLQEHIDETINSMLIMHTQGFNGRGAMHLVNGLVLPLPELEDDWETEF